jgi:hypothetical protein
MIFCAASSSLFAENISSSSNFCNPRSFDLSKWSVRLSACAFISCLFSTKAFITASNVSCQEGRLKALFGGK